MILRTLLIVSIFIAGNLAVAGCTDPVRGDIAFRTERLELRAVDSSVLEQALLVWADPAVLEMSGDQTNRKIVRQTLKHGMTNLSVVQNSPRPYMNFGVFKNGELIGMCQLGSGQESVVYLSKVGGFDERWMTISYTFKSSAWGMGYATEAARGLINFAFEKLNADGIHADTIPSNMDSQNVLNKLGFKRIQFEPAKNVHFYLRRSP